MPDAVRITPLQLNQLWHQQSGELESQRLMGFANAVLTLARNLHVPEEQPLEVLDLPTGAYNALRRAGLHTVEAVARLNERQLMGINNIGAKYALWIREAVDSHMARVQQEACTKALCSAIPDGPFQPTDSAELQGILIEQAFYTMKEDRERIAAVLLQARDLFRGPSAAERVEAVAMSLMSHSVAA